MSVVICCDGAREWYRDIFVNEGELYCSPRVQDNLPKTKWRPTGEYDLAAYVRSLPPPWNEPSLLVMFEDSSGSSYARNVAPITCPKVFIIGDTHHFCAPGGRPIGRLIDQTLADKYDLIVGMFDRHHLHFLREAGCGTTAWLPSFLLTTFEHPADTPKRRNVTFVGQTGRHPYRKHILEQLKNMGVPIEQGSAPQRETAGIQAESHINLNISLNNDFNLRVMEVMATGSMLLTERLSPESGLSLLFEEYRHLVAFDNVEQLAELIRHYLAHPDEAAAIGRAGQEEYMRAHRPAIKARQIVEMAQGNIPERYRLDLDRRTSLPPQPLAAVQRRVALYEFLQELHRINIRLDVLFWRGAEREACDAVDLNRLKAAVLRGAVGGEGGGGGGGGSLLITAHLDARVRWVNALEIENALWPLVVVPAAALVDPLFQRCLQSRRIQAWALADYDAARDRPEVEALVRQFGLAVISQNPLAFAFPPPKG